MGRHRTLPDYPCAVCSTVFRPRNRTDKYCSPECCSISRRADKKKCLLCQVLFQPKYSEQRYCSHTCGTRSQVIDKVVICQFCSTTFKRPNGKPRAFCTRRCAMLARNSGQAANYEELIPKARSTDGYYTTSQGYRARKVNGKSILQHREVAEQMLGRTLDPKERVHHKNGVRDDNRPENLELWTVNHKDPAGVRAIDHARHAISKLSDVDRARLTRELQAGNPTHGGNTMPPR